MTQESCELREGTALLVIDIQERLIPAMDKEDSRRCLKSTGVLIELAKDFGADIIYTEQYPRGLGPSDASLLEGLTAANALRFEKTHFDACQEPGFAAVLSDLPARVMVCGMETHVCVLSTVRSLLLRGRQVFVPFDAVSSRLPEYRKNGLARMESMGAVITNSESIVFDTLVHSRHEEFKKFSGMIR